MGLFIVAFGCYLLFLGVVICCALLVCLVFVARFFAVFECFLLDLLAVV